MTGARRRILVAAVLGVVLLGPALAMSLWSLRAISLEQEELLEFQRILNWPNQSTLSGQFDHHYLEKTLCVVLVVQRYKK